MVAARVNANGRVNEVRFIVFRGSLPGVALPNSSCCSSKSSKCQSDPYNQQTGSAHLLKHGGCHSILPTCAANSLYINTLDVYDRKRTKLAAEQSWYEP